MAGRPPTYHSDDGKPVSVSLRMPRALYEQAQRYASQHRMTLTEFVFNGVRLKLETPANPRAALLSDDRNTVIQELREDLKGALLEELRKDVQGLLASTVQVGLMQSPHPALPPHELPHYNSKTVLQESSQP